MDNKNIFFSNNLSYKVSHIAACDGIRSISREKFIDQTKPTYSGYSVWRAILDKEQAEIRFHLGSNFHVVTYPISNNQTSFVAAIKILETIKITATISKFVKNTPMKK